MSKDPAFLFYPGDYLRDTQCLSESVQVAYDRIMCEHMRNICISKKQLNFFTKRLNGDEKEELLMVLDETDKGFQILWVAESIEKRLKYSESRRNNRKGNRKKDDNICETRDSHMENEDEIEIVNAIKEEFNKARKIYPGTKRGLEPEFKNLKKKYPKFKEIIPLLFAAIENQIKNRTNIPEGIFIPEWKNFQTWINQECWTEEPAQIITKETESDRIEREYQDSINKKGTGQNGA